MVLWSHDAPKSPGLAQAWRTWQCHDPRAAEWPLACGKGPASRTFGQSMRIVLATLLATPND